MLVADIKFNSLNSSAQFKIINKLSFVERIAELFRVAIEAMRCNVYKMDFHWNKFYSGVECQEIARVNTQEIDYMALMR